MFTWRKVFLFIIASFFLIRIASANVTTVVLPNGGECLTSGQSYTIQFSWSGSDVEHIALYYRTNGQQPSHLDSSVIKHPINVPQQGTTWNWTPGTGDISETGRIWIDGHGHNHASLGTWDSSNADFAVRSNCVSSGSSAQITVWQPTSPTAPIGFTTPARVSDIIPTISSARMRFESPWANGEYRIRLLENLDGRLKTVQVQEKPVKLGDIIEFIESDLLPNKFYQPQRFIQAYDFATGFESVISEATPPFWTLIDAPKQIRVSSLTATSTLLHIADTVPNFFEGRSQAFFENITAVEETEASTATSSGWISTTTWLATGLEPDTQYQFWAKFRNGEGVESAFGGLVVVKTLPLPPPVKENIQEEKKITAPSSPVVIKEILLTESKGFYEQLKDVQHHMTALEQMFTRFIVEWPRRQRIAQRSLTIDTSITQPTIPLPIAPLFKKEVSIAEPTPLTPEFTPQPLVDAQDSVLNLLKDKPIEDTGPLVSPPMAVRRSRKTFVVLIEDGHFNPRTLTIRAGDTVRFLSNTNQPFWPASDPHPTHTGLPSFDALGDLRRGESYRYTFRKAGVWPYHNHTEAKAEEVAAEGLIIVTP